MKTMLTLGLLATLASAPLLAADCVYPKSPIDKIPSGSAAAKEELIAARKTVQEYIAAMDTYLECLGTEYTANSTKADATEEQKTQLKTVFQQKSDAAQGEKEAVGLRMNEQLRAYNEKNKKPK